MIEDRIEEAAIKYAFNECSKKDIDQYDLDSLLFDAFCSGINWFKENLWHDSSEEPEEGKRLFVERTFTGKKSYAEDINYNGWQTKVNREEISRWLYIDDLMKEGK